MNPLATRAFCSASSPPAALRRIFIMCARCRLWLPVAAITCTWHTYIISLGVAEGNYAASVAKRLCRGDGYIDERGYLFCQGTLVGTGHGNMRQEFLSSRVHCQEGAEMLKEVGNGRWRGRRRGQPIADDYCQAASSGIGARDESYGDINIYYPRKEIPGRETGWIIGETYFISRCGRIMKAAFAHKNGGNLRWTDKRLYFPARSISLDTQ